MVKQLPKEELVIQNDNTISTKIIKKEPIEKEIVKPENKLKKEVINTKYNRYNRYNSQETKKKELIKEQEIITKKIYIKDIFKEEVLEIGKYIYIEMNNINSQRKAVKAWDNFECLINKTTDDKEAMIRMIRILNKFQSAGILSTTEKYEEEKILRKIYK